LLAVSSFANPNHAPWTLTEEALVEKIYTDATVLSRLRATEQNILSQQLEQEAAYQPTWKNELYYQNSREKALAFFIPTFGPTHGFRTGLAQDFSRGISGQANFFADLTNTNDGSIDRATRTGINLQGRMDLWRNFLGRMDQAKLQSQQLQLKKTELENKISLRTFELDLRKMYWSLVSIEEKLVLAEKLLEGAQRQYKDSLNRKKNYIADSTETSRYKAQVSDRQATIYALRYQRDTIHQQIKQFFPALAGHPLVMGEYDREQAVNQVLTCIDNIRAYSQTPWQYTPMDELLTFIEEDYKQRKILDDQYDNVDVALQTEVQISGVDRGYANSFEDFANNGKPGFSVGLMVDVPLGKAKNKVEHAKLRALEANFQAEHKETMAMVESQQSQLLAMIDTLFASMRNYKANTQTLQQNVSRLEQKYKQARVDVRDLVLEQDALSQNALNEVDAHLAVMQVLLDYFKIFTQDPCVINQLHVAHMQKAKE
jgi:outer membrane protein TolC